jgi:enamine deaminase RidA (YjgF/YER057c/UK114 family)
MKLAQPSYRLVFPTSKGDFEAQWESCFHEVTLHLSDPLIRVFRIHVFLNYDSTKDFKSRSARISQSFQNCSPCPPFSIISQAPEHPYEVVISLGSYKAEEAEVNYNRNLYPHASAVKFGGYEEFWLLGVSPETQEGAVTESAFSIHDTLAAYCNELGITMNQVVRQWNYIGKILDFTQVEGKPRQHYQVFNDARKIFYQQARNAPYYPAATGIGQQTPGILIDCMAVNAPGKLDIIPIHNPSQQDSYHYGQEVLKGVADRAIGIKQPPLFERAVLLATAESSRLLISGTAAIKGQETIALGDVKRQTEVTIENIDLLSAQSTLAAQYPKLSSYPDTYSYVRVYVANREDIPLVRSICNGCFGNAPVNYVQADVCRDDLLVEIEAERVS